jgi:DNA polymerase III psi subunit
MLNGLGGFGVLSQTSAVPSQYANAVAQTFAYILQATQGVAATRGSKAQKSQAATYRKYLKTAMPALRKQMLYLGQSYPSASIASILQSSLDSQTYAGVVSQAAAAKLSALLNQTFGSVYRSWKSSQVSASGGGGSALQQQEQQMLTQQGAQQAAQLQYSQQVSAQGAAQAATTAQQLQQTSQSASQLWQQIAAHPARPPYPAQSPEETGDFGSQGEDVAMSDGGDGGCYGAGVLPC